MSEYRAGLEEVKAIYATHAGMPVQDALNAFGRWFHRARERAREDERERIAQTIEAEADGTDGSYADGMQHAARIAREVGK